MTRKILKVILIIALIISSIFVFSGCGKKDNKNNGKEEVSKDVYEAPLRNYMEGIKTKDIELVLSAYPEFMRKMTQTDLDSIYARYEAMYGSNITMEYKLGDATRIVEDKDLGVLAAQIKEYYPEAGDITVSDAYIITVELSISGDGAEEGEEDGEAEKPSKKTDSQDFYVYRTGDNWYIF
ncbi:MAG: hypothetical protein IKE91_03895 [Clostridia bacterium]|nr:hypothetical protein [Clostridia bacterium]